VEVIGDPFGMLRLGCPAERTFGIRRDLPFGFDLQRVKVLSKAEFFS
jgi:hypothetical protein